MGVFILFVITLTSMYIIVLKDVFLLAATLKSSSSITLLISYDNLNDLVLRVTAGLGVYSPGTYGLGVCGPGIYSLPI